MALLLRQTLETIAYLYDSGQTEVAASAHVCRHSETSA